MNKSHRRTSLNRSFSIVVGVLSLSMTAAPKAFAESYDAAMKTIQSQLRMHQVSAAEAALTRLAQRFPRNPEVLAMRMRLACTRQDFTAAHQFGEENPASDELRDSVTFCATEQHYVRAQNYLAQHLPAQAITTLMPLVQQKNEGYRAGRMLASAYVANNQPEKAEALYRQLAQRYPADASDLLHHAEQLYDDSALIAPQKYLAAGDFAAAISSAKPLFDSGHDRYRTGLLLAKAYAGDRQFGAAASTYEALAQNYPNDHDLSILAQQNRQAFVVANAKNLIDRGENAAAVAYLEPYYPALTDRYQAGLLLLQANRAMGNKSRVAALTTALAHAYPADTSLAPAAVVAAVADGQFTAALDGYARLAPSQQALVLTEFGGNGDRLSQRSITLIGAVGSSNAHRGQDEQGGVRLKLASQIGTVMASAVRVRRFGQSANEFGVGFGADLGHRSSGEIAYTRSTGSTILARQSITLALSHSLAMLDLYGSVRHLIYSTAVADVLYAGISKPLAAHSALRAGVFYVPQSNAFSILGGIDSIDGHGDKSFVTVTAGRAGEQTGFRDSVLRSATYSVALGRLLNFSNQMSLLGSVNYEHRAGLFNRLGTNLELTKGW